jgi:hypothetical protein
VQGVNVNNRWDAQHERVYLHGDWEEFDGLARERAGPCHPGQRSASEREKARNAKLKQAEAGR